VNRKASFFYFFKKKALEYIEKNIPKEEQGYFKDLLDAEYNNWHNVLDTQGRNALKQHYQSVGEYAERIKQEQLLNPAARGMGNTNHSGSIFVITAIEEKIKNAIKNKKTLNLSNKDMIKYIKMKQELRMEITKDDHTALMNTMSQNKNTVKKEMIEHISENQDRYKALFQGKQFISKGGQAFKFDINNQQTIEYFAQYINDYSCSSIMVYGIMLGGKIKGTPDSFGEFYLKNNESGAMHSNGVRVTDYNKILDTHTGTSNQYTFEIYNNVSDFYNTNTQNGGMAIRPDGGGLHFIRTIKNGDSYGIIDSSYRENYSYFLEYKPFKFYRIKKVF